MANYHYDFTLGNEENNGLSPTTPWKFSPGMGSSTSGGTLVAGDSCNGKRGETWREQLIIPSPGSVGSPITFGAYGTGNGPKITGLDPVSGFDLSSNILTSNIAAANDDSYSRRSAHDWYTQDSGNINMAGGSALVDGIFRFQLNIPGGATIKSASITFRCGLNQTGTIKLLISGQAADNAPQITSHAAWHTNHDDQLTTANIDWTIVNPVSGNDYQTPSMVALISEIVNRPGWVSNNYINIFLDENGSTDSRYFVVQAFENAGTNEAVLSVEYELTNIWQKTGITTEPKQVYFDNIKGNKCANLSALSSPGDWYWASNILYVYGTSDPDILYTLIEIGQRDYSADLNGKEHITIHQLDLTGANIGGVRIPPKSGYQHGGFVTNAGTVIEDFENAGDWSLTGTDATLDDDTANKITGTKSLKLSGSAGVITMTKTVNLDLSGDGNFLLGIYLPAQVNDTYFRLEFSSTTDFSKYFRFQEELWNTLYPGGDFKIYSIPKAEFSNTGSESWSNAMIRLRLTVWDSPGGGAAEATFDTLRFGYQGKAVCLFAFDDGYKTIYDNAYPILKANKQAATIFATTNFITTGPPDYISVAQATELYNDGWDIANHTVTHPATLEGANGATLEAEINGGRTVLLGWGFSRSADYFSHPGVTYDANVTAKLAENHTLAWNGQGGRSAHPSGISNDYYRMLGYSLSTPAAIKSRIDKAIARSAVLILACHNVSDEVGVSISDFTEISNYLASNSDSITTMTFSEYYNGRGPQGITLAYNIIEDNIIGVKIEAAGTHGINNNIIKNNESVGLDVSRNRASISYYQKNNIFYQNGDDASGLQSKSLASSLPLSGAMIDYNLYYQTGKTNLVQSEGTNYATLAALKAATSWEANGIEGDPLFIDPDNGNFKLQPTSPCRDAGVDVGLTQDYEGKPVPRGIAPDIGAYEFQPSGGFKNMGLGMGM